MSRSGGGTGWRWRVGSPGRSSARRGTVGWGSCARWARGAVPGGAGRRRRTRPSAGSWPTPAPTPWRRCCAGGPRRAEVGTWDCPLRARPLPRSTNSRAVEATEVAIADNGITAHFSAADCQPRSRFDGNRRYSRSRRADRSATGRSPLGDMGAMTPCRTQIRWRLAGISITSSDFFNVSSASGRGVGRFGSVTAASWPNNA